MQIESHHRSNKKPSLARSIYTHVRVLREVIMNQQLYTNIHTPSSSDRSLYFPVKEMVSINDLMSLINYNNNNTTMHNIVINNAIIFNWRWFYFSRLRRRRQQLHDSTIHSLMIVSLFYTYFFLRIF